MWRRCPGVAGAVGARRRAPGILSTAAAPRGGPRCHLGTWGGAACGDRVLVVLVMGPVGGSAGVGLGLLVGVGRPGGRRSRRPMGSGLQRTSCWGKRGHGVVRASWRGVWLGLRCMWVVECPRCGVPWRVCGFLGGPRLGVLRSVACGPLPGCGGLSRCGGWWVVCGVPCCPGGGCCGSVYVVGVGFGSLCRGSGWALCGLAVRVVGGWGCGWCVGRVLEWGRGGLVGVGCRGVCGSAAVCCGALSYGGLLPGGVGVLVGGAAVGCWLAVVV